MNYYLYLLCVILTVVPWGISLLLLWGLHRQWWSIPPVRRLFWRVPLVGLGFVALWFGAELLDWEWIAVPLSVVAMIVVVAGMGLLITLPITGLLLTGERLGRWATWKFSGGRKGSSTERAAVGSVPAPVQQQAAESVSAPLPQQVAAPHIIVDHRHHPHHPVKPIVQHSWREAPVDQGRRSLLTKGAAALPAATIAMAGWGVISSYNDTTIPVVPLRYAGLPAGLEGLRILHLSDIHIGLFFFLEDLERTMEIAARHKPDIVLVTGDVSDEIHRLPDALRIIHALRPRYGTYAALGNHEYYRGIESVQRHFDAGPIPLLREAGRAIRINGSDLFIGGTDDPARRGSERNKHAFLRTTVDATLDGAPSDAFHIVMSHRPEGWDEAARNGIELTLSGHYHGGIQWGFNGRGIIESMTPNNYIWGHYRRGESQLYTSAGVGHWFPFRLGCPAEAPLYVLTGA